MMLHPVTTRGWWFSTEDKKNILDLCVGISVTFQIEKGVIYRSCLRTALFSGASLCGIATSVQVTRNAKTVHSEMTGIEEAFPAAALKTTRPGHGYCSKEDGAQSRVPSPLCA